MPNVWTHSIYGELLLDRLSIRDWTAGDPVSPALFRLGCQGPDPLFYHRFYPWMKSAAAQSDNLGSLLHKSRCGPFLRTLLKNCGGSAPASPQVVYTLGWLAHHTLDRVAHPFVFARQGHNPRDHQRLETALDTIVAERLRGIDTARASVRQTLNAGPRLPEAVTRLVEQTIRTTYPELDAPPLEGLWQQSYRDMLAAFRLFHDPSGVKRKLLGRAIEPFVPGRRGDPKDPANESRAPWQPPADKARTSQESFWDVWERALLDGEHVLSAASAWIAAAAHGGEEAAETCWNSFTDALGDLSYETGLPSDP